MHQNRYFFIQISFGQNKDFRNSVGEKFSFNFGLIGELQGTSSLTIFCHLLGASKEDPSLWYRYIGRTSGQQNKFFWKVIKILRSCVIVSATT